MDGITEYRMIQDYPNTRPTPEERVQEARRTFRARYGREPRRLLVNPAQATAGAEAEGRVGLGVVFCLIEPDPEQHFTAS
jgi:hypothetical protein